MIQSRRQAHFYTVTVLCGLLPLVAIAAMILRPSVPLVQKDDLFAIANFADPDHTQSLQAFAPIFVQNVEISTRVVQQDQQTYLEMTPQETLEFADILVYWLPSNAKIDEIDEQAVLLGKLSGTHSRQFVLQNDLIEASKQLLFYSQAQSKVIGVASLNVQENAS